MPTAAAMMNRLFSLVLLLLCLGLLSGCGSLRGNANQTVAPNTPAATVPVVSAIPGWTIVPVGDHL
jgi:uncharacterized protein YceK